MATVWRIARPSGIWRSLTDSMGREQARQLLRESEKMMDTPEAGYVESVLQIASKANRKVFHELKRCTAQW